MGMTKTFCYCVSPARRCKVELSEKLSVTEDPHWRDILRNCRTYLAEAPCVPNTDGDAAYHSDVIKGLRQYLSALRRARLPEAKDAPWYLARSTECADVCVELHRVARGLLAGTPSDSTAEAALPLADLDGVDDEGGRMLQVAQVLAEAFARASLELESAVHQGMADHVAHHYALLVDVLHEMQALTLAAIGEVREQEGEADIHDPRKPAALA